MMKKIGMMVSIVGWYLQSPGRCPKKEIQVFQMKKNIRKIRMKVGMLHIIYVQ